MSVCVCECHSVCDYVCVCWGRTMTRLTTTMSPVHQCEMKMMVTTATAISEVKMLHSVSSSGVSIYTFVLVTQVN